MANTVYIFGANGFLGSRFRSLAEHPRHAGDRFFFPGRRQLDLGDFAPLSRAFRDTKPDYVVNCAGFREVDLAESRRDEARLANVTGVQNLARACLESGAKLVHFSTHGVFDGEKAGPYFESDPPRPRHYYGQTKWEGEREAAALLPPEKLLILRISWPYGPGGNNFISKILLAARSSDCVRVVADEYGVPNPASLLAEKTLEIMAEAQGLLHLTCSGSCSRYEAISLMVQSLRIPCRVIPALSKDFPPAAPRPKNIAIATERADWAGRLSMPGWREAWESFLARGESAV